MKDRVEFYDNKSLVVAIESSMVPPVDSLISIRGETWLVWRVTYALDYADGSRAEQRMRANVDISPRKK